MTIDEKLLEEWKKPTYDKERDRLITAHFRQQDMGNNQAIMKITGYGSNYEKVCDHINYIAQNYDPEKAAGVEDEQGMFYDDPDIANQVIEEWSADFRRVKPTNEKVSASLTLKLDEPESQQNYYRKLKSYASLTLSDYEWRVDKSRSKSRPNDVTLRVKGNALELQNIKELLDDYGESGAIKSDYEVKVPKLRLPREVMKMVVSSPEGTDPEKVRIAAREFAKDAFSEQGYRYLMALHTNTNNPHAHLVIKMKNEKGERLTTSKQDLMYWRQLWAEKAREQGIMVEASYVKSRGKGKKSEKSQVKQMRKENQRRVLEGKKERPIYTDKKVDQDKKDIKEQGKYELSSAEQRQLATNLDEREAHIEAAKALIDRAATLSDPEEQKRMRQSASILAKESIEMPSPRSKMTALAKDSLGVKVKIPEALKEQLATRQQALSDKLNEPTKRTQNVTYRRRPSQDKGDELEIE